MAKRRKKTHEPLSLAPAEARSDNGAMTKRGTRAAPARNKRVGAGRAVIARNVEEAVAAARAAAARGVALTVVSPPGAGSFAGPIWFQALARAARAQIGTETPVTFVLDCGESPGAVLAAVRAKVEAVSFAGKGPARARLAAIAKRAGMAFRAPPLDVFDMTRNPGSEALIAWFSSPRASLQSLPRSAKRTATQRPAPKSRGSRARHPPTGANRS
jgi:hypothetical protein